jgi:hypothetical protein
LGHVSANAGLVADVIAALHVDEAGPDPVTFARIERDRDNALARYRRDRDEVNLGETMRRLDREETEAKATNADIPTAAEAVEYLRDLARLWHDAEGSGRKQLAEALFERIDVLGARKLNVHPSAAAKGQGWAEAWNGARLVVMVGARGLEPTNRIRDYSPPSSEMNAAGVRTGIRLASDVRCTSPETRTARSAAARAMR